MKQEEFNAMVNDFIYAMIIYRHIIAFFGFSVWGFMLIQGVL